MIKNNHLSVTFRRLDGLLKDQAAETRDQPDADVYTYARCMADVEHVIAVVSDLCNGTSRIFNGGFATALGISGYCEENSIWEKKVLSLMSDQEQEEKFIAEIRFIHYLRKLGPSRRHYYLMSKLRFEDAHGRMIDVLHRMYYVYDVGSESVRYAICLYGPLSVDFRGKGIAVNSLTGSCVELSSSSDSGLISRRERQVLKLIDSGLKSREIADRLCISVHTVSRHRQEILSRLHVNNSIEACRLARSMGLI